MPTKNLIVLHVEGHTIVNFKKPSVFLSVAECSRRDHPGERTLRRVQQRKVLSSRGAHSIERTDAGHVCAGQNSEWYIVNLISVPNH